MIKELPSLQVFTDFAGVLFRWSVILCWAVAWPSLQRTSVTSYTCCVVIGCYHWSTHHRPFPCRIASKRHCEGCCQLDVRIVCVGGSRYNTNSTAVTSSCSSFACIFIIQLYHLCWSCWFLYEFYKSVTCTYIWFEQFSILQKITHLFWWVNISSPCSFHCLINSCYLMECLNQQCYLVLVHSPVSFMPSDIVVETHFYNQLRCLLFTFYCSQVALVLDYVL